MALKETANEDMKLEFTITAGPPDAFYAGDQSIDLIKVVPTLSTKCKANNKKIGTTGVTITWTSLGCAYTSATYTFVAGSGTVSPTAVKTRAQGQLVLREDDTGTCVGTAPAGGWTQTASPFTPIPCACNVKISDAGQAKVRAQ